RPGSRFGLITHGMIHNTTIRALEVLGIRDVSILCLNVLNPLVPEQILGFLSGKDHVLIVEEGAPAFLEDQMRAMVQRAGGGSPCLYGKDVLPMAGEYSPEVLLKGLSAFVARDDTLSAKQACEV